MARTRRFPLFLVWIALLALVLLFGAFLLYVGLTEPMFTLPGGASM